MSHPLVDAAEEMLLNVKHSQGAPVIRDLFALHPGLHGFRSDFRGLAAAMTDSWGIFVARGCMSGAWFAPIIRALKDGVLLIKPLELITCAMTICVAKKELVVAAGGKVVWRNDNLSAITDINNDRALSKPMLEALMIFERQ